MLIVNKASEVAVMRHVYVDTTISTRSGNNRTILKKNKYDLYKILLAQRHSVD